MALATCQTECHLFMPDIGLDNVILSCCKLGVYLSEGKWQNLPNGHLVEISWHTKLKIKNQRNY